MTAAPEKVGSNGQLSAHRPVARSPRLVSLDLLRGLAVMGMILVNSAAGMFYSAKAPVFPLLLHVRWDGLTLADMVFPAFLMMVGVSIPFSLAREQGQVGTRAAVERRICARALRLIVLGFLLSNIYWFADFASGSWRLFGVLQRIGLVYGACALLYWWCKPRTLATVIVATLILYWPLTLLPALDGLPNDLWVRGHNFVVSVDRVLLGAGGHNYVRGPEGYDPEGLLGTIPAIAHGLIGVLIGIYLQARPERGSGKALAAAGAAMLLAGLVWGLAFPVVKDIWSSTFVLVTSGLTTLALAALHGLADGRDRLPGGWPATIVLGFGSNAVAAYVLHMLTSSMIGWDLLQRPYLWAAGVLPGQWASLLPVLLYMALIGWAMMWLRQRGWFIKV
ncbi:heparan-alpha-glucosaminide N-acetyltransferase domain-containing protein [Sphingomonas sp. PL-96]|uniref:acyltransferase family protein n=1 Tax=Sphingomonas sp. PL-96 TaxID=2887201 RepID=UPI00226D1F8B|nr:heparan-alpha-glucosaminide N-acetyltransferase domain-containing protein [Sphingomonas sp. PL-96]MCC2975932.1 heparan-alpha-glucosaminide N-acetyltransferase domain-containing protein [Sphingomonas sp. PL-96]